MTVTQRRLGFLEVMRNEQSLRLLQTKTRELR
nr:MAG TPA: hypothetical protein [Caudoviricetes sp.]DAS31957.1 MAG TPA: hypothetical protein [Caudoviricetes sp.]